MRVGSFTGRRLDRMGEYWDGRNLARRRSSKSSTAGVCISTESVLPRPQALPHTPPPARAWIARLTQAPISPPADELSTSARTSAGRSAPPGRSRTGTLFLAASPCPHEPAPNTNRVHPTPLDPVVLTDWLMFDGWFTSQLSGGRFLSYRMYSLPLYRFGRLTLDSRACYTSTPAYWQFN